MQKAPAPDFDSFTWVITPALQVAANLNAFVELLTPQTEPMRPLLITGALKSQEILQLLKRAALQSTDSRNLKKNFLMAALFR